MPYRFMRLFLLLQTIDQVAATDELGGRTIEVDYFGRPIRDTSRVGPFQQLAPGPNRFPLVSEEMLIW